MEKRFLGGEKKNREALGGVGKAIGRRGGVVGKRMVRRKSDWWEGVREGGDTIGGKEGGGSSAWRWWWFRARPGGGRGDLAFLSLLCQNLLGTAPVLAHTPDDLRPVGRPGESAAGWLG